MTVEINGFEELADRLEELADSFETSLSDPDDEKRAIQRGITQRMEDTVVPEAKTRVPVRTGRLKGSVAEESRGWDGEQYRHVYGSTLDEDYARVQEFGTRKTNYQITPNGDYPLQFNWSNAPPGFSNPVRFAFVTHPGVQVQQPGPMQSALEDNVSAIQGTVGNEVQQALEDKLD